MGMDVFLDTGVAVRLPPGVDPDTDEGYEVLKELAKQQFLELLRSGTFDLLAERNDLDVVAGT
jgi:hypothetical protein